MINSRSLKLCSSTDYVVRPSTGDERQVFQIQVCVVLLEIFYASIYYYIFISGNFLSQHTFCGSFVRSSRDTTSRTKPSPSGCMALSPWWGPSRGFLIRRCLSTKPGNTPCSAQTGLHMSPFCLWVRF